jgi:hypothetical protein
MDDDGRMWTEIPRRKRRKSPRAVRFAEIKVGDQLMREYRLDGFCSIDRKDRVQIWYYVVTDLWFDPCAGQHDETAGRMVAIQSICPRTGDPRPHKEPHTLRGLASQGFHFADIDFLAHAKARNQAMADGAVVGIGKGHVIRRRPTVPGARF